MENIKLTKFQIDEAKAGELSIYDRWYIRKMRTGLEVPEWVTDATNEIDKKYNDLENGIQI